ncbi:hypothetical protein [Brucella sp. 10RB9214]|uniref:hypothetical protein n=1 Tax=Brucella sp. 10RB9214 TaxID=1844040 RepID=UPI00189CF4D6|nr:hypothetical protein [Brucella sp. 10RB9214]
MANQRREAVNYQKLTGRAILSDGLLGVAREGGDLERKVAEGFFRLAGVAGQIANEYAEADGARAGRAAAMAGSPGAATVSGRADPASAGGPVGGKFALGDTGKAARRDAIASIESRGSGDYAAIGPRHPTMGRALGRYQVMEANIGPWSKAALGREVTVDEFIKNPDIQDAISRVACCHKQTAGRRLRAGGASPVSALTGMLIGIAAKVGAPLVKEVLQRQLGGAAGDVAGSVIDMIAGKLGVGVDDLSSQDPDELGNAIQEVERDNADVLRINLESQQETSRLLLAPLEAKQPTWTWAWLPAWQWFLLFAWFWRIVLAPTINGALNANVELVPLSDLAWITTVYMGLHMGGNTAKSFFQARWGK